MPGRTSYMSRLMQRRKLIEAGDPLAASRHVRGKKVEGPTAAASAAGLGKGKRGKKNSRSEY